MYTDDKWCWGDHIHVVNLHFRSRGDRDCGSRSCGSETTKSVVKSTSGAERTCISRPFWTVNHCRPARPYFDVFRRAVFDSPASIRGVYLISTDRNIMAGLRLDPYVDKFLHTVQHHIDKFLLST